MDCVIEFIVCCCLALFLRCLPIGWSLYARQQRRQRANSTSSRFVECNHKIHSPLVVKILQDVPVRDIEYVCECLSEILGDIMHGHLAKAKKESKNPKDGLTSDESAAIYLYTTGWEQFNTGLKEAVRGQDHGKLKYWYPYLKLFFTALDKLP